MVVFGDGGGYVRLYEVRINPLVSPHDRYKIYKYSIVERLYWLRILLAACICLHLSESGLHSRCSHPDPHPYAPCDEG